MSDRLAELRRQHALVQQHLAWLDREIAEETLQAGSAAVQVPPAACATVVPAAASAAPAGEPTLPAPAPDPDAILAQYRTSSDSLRTDVRKGCLLYFVAALGAFAAGVGLLYFVF